MNTADGMSDEELDVWADIFYQGKIGGLIAVTFSQFISSPSMHLSSALQRMDRPVKETPCLHQVYSKDPSPKISQGMLQNSALNRLSSRGGDYEAA